ncbi:hypothetical protein PF005_g27137 [Phytophthora fragariae]|uniref:Uncharacterized protein n=2 Tax=Phytophthora TaxID=4783 RepID=A0A6A3ELT4_9STRA|nr:hypothetical protein PF009_g15565 [Phytophthora fragariae]KAE9036070.1 hypothetical protein PR002_g7265 [Phytophthora rubi]KAE8971302.1 hypothetical protein PF011_g26083 [Phytophthora fragariae]KAE9040956.1 hypothetical protein PR001_g6842 [Phytophthora rubi]KAE9069913.1 hypothetical protein PF010_g26485 [Phytophthora fragariae]
MGKRAATYTAKDVVDAVGRVMAGERVLPISKALNLPYRTLHDRAKRATSVRALHRTVGDRLLNFPGKQKMVLSSGLWLASKLGIQWIARIFFAALVIFRCY